MKIRIGLFLGITMMFCGSIFQADVIYLKNGNVLVVEKAWVEGDQVKYQIASGTLTIPRSSVKRLQEQKAKPADPSRDQSVNAEVIRGTSGPVAAPTATNLKASSASTTTTRERARSSRFKDAAGYDEALRQQQASHKPIVLYFYADWCGYCAKLERNVLSQQEVQEYLDSVLYVSVNPEHGKAEETLFEKFEGSGYPTVLILAKDQPVQEVRTAVPPTIFIQSCKDTVQGKGQ